jgi:hypothetical protein
MRFSFAAVAIVIAAAFTSAAVVPRSYLERPSGLEARSYQEEVYPRAANTVPVEADLARRQDPELQTRRLHVRDFRSSDRVVLVRREVEPDLKPRFLHPRDFGYSSRPVVVVAREEPPAPEIFAREAPSDEAFVVIARRDEPQLFRRRLHPRDFRSIRAD